MGEDTTWQIIVKFAFYISGQAFGIGVVVERGEKGLQVFRDHLVEDCAARVTGFVGGSSRRAAGVMRAPTYSIAVIEVTGNVTDCTVHMCTIKEK